MSSYTSVCLCLVTLVSTYTSVRPMSSYTIVCPMSSYTSVRPMSSYTSVRPMSSYTSVCPMSSMKLNLCSDNVTYYHDCFYNFTCSE